ncbi:hypothetical protein [Defluviitalea saccharophila]
MTRVVGGFFSIVGVGGIIVFLLLP